MASSPEPKKASNYDTFVPFTARMMAAVRAEESARPDALFDDPFAAQLAGEAGFQAVAQRLSQKDRAYITMRTCFFDAWLLSHAADQIVVLAAGLDTRAYRLALPPHLTFFECDHPQVLRFKAEQLRWMSPVCGYHAIGADLTQPWEHKLLAAGFDPNRPSIWLLEGLLMYLSSEQVRALLATISNLASIGSHLGCDLINVLGRDYAAYAGYFQSGWDQPEALLSDYGWGATVLQPGDAETRFDRYLWPSTPRNVPDIPRAFLIQAKRLESVPHSRIQ